MQSTPEFTRDRLRRTVEALQARIYPERRAPDRLRVAGPTGRIKHAEALKLRYRKAKLGMQFGPQWSTWWFDLTATVPPEWAGKPVALLWNSFAETTVWQDGRSLLTLNYGFPGRNDHILTPNAAAGQQLRCQLEMTCNGLFARHQPATTVSKWLLDQCEIAVMDQLAWDIWHDLVFLVELEAEFAREDGTTDKPFAGELLYQLNRFCNVFDLDNRDTWRPAREILAHLYQYRNGTSMHKLSAIGHAHIDTAWLWPLAETWRKIERTWSTVITFMDMYPEYMFCASSAYQFEVIKQRNPDLYRRILSKVAERRFVPVGGTWIEPDCNIPSGENLVRQFLLGQRFFEREFGFRAREFWNPDVFRYNGQLPQLIRGAGMERFLTQKLSWNRFNKPRFSTFYWEGIDGSQVLTHFPPADTYSAELRPAELRRNIREHKEHGRSNRSLLLFGWGDGGGGPTKHHLEFARRARDIEGLPRVQMESPSAFFDRLQAETVDLPKVVGELYLEAHRGTFTTQGWIKQKMRRAEFALHDAEFLTAMAARTTSSAYPREELTRLWQLVCLNDFHDILPGSSIRDVNELTWQQLEEVIASAGELVRNGAALLVPAKAGVVPFNTTGFARREVVALPDATLAIAEAPPYGIGRLVADSVSPVIAQENADTIKLENDHLVAVLAKDGTLLSLHDKQTGREALTAPGNVLELHDDLSTKHDLDAWEVDPHSIEAFNNCPPASGWQLRSEPQRAEVVFERPLSKTSRMLQTVRLDATARRLEFHCQVDWQDEKDKFLKVMFPVNVRAMNATYEMQFGVAERPTHQNTTADLARYEVPGHKWADISQHGYGVALLSDCKYGWSTLGNQMRLSLLRAPKFPDDQADMGHHAFAYAIYPHAGGWQDAGVVAEAFAFNSPLQLLAGSSADTPIGDPSAEAGEPGTACGASFASVDDSNLVLNTIKLAEDSDALIVRLYEAHGGSGHARLRVSFPFARATECNLLEDDLRELSVRGAVIEFDYGPFEVKTIKLA